MVNPPKSLLPAYRRSMLIAEDLLLLLYDDETGKPIKESPELEYALAGAVVIELALLGKLELADEDEEDKPGDVQLLDATPTGDPILDERLAHLADKDGKRLRGRFGKLAKDLPEQVRARLAERGVLEATRGKVLGLFPVTRWPAKDAAHEAEVRIKLESALTVGTTPDQRTGALIALISAVDAVPKVLTGAVDKKALKRRAKEITESDHTLERLVSELRAALLVAAVWEDVAESSMRGGA